jgi:tetratricopeptide (TPR) repeat protein
MRHQLFSFIHQLNKQEKRYFKLYASQLAGEEGNMYTHLFDLIESNENIDEEYIKELYCKKFDPKTYISTKFYLKVKLLETLRSMQIHTQPTVEQEVQQLMENAFLFHQKNFVTLCEREILKAEKLAEETEHWNLLYNVIEKKLSFYYDIFMNGKNCNIENVQKIIEKKNDTLLRLQEDSSVLNVLYEVKMYLKKWTEDSRTYMEQLLQLPIMQHPPQSILTQINFYVTKAIIYKYLVNNEQYSQCYQKVFDLWQQSSIIKQTDVKGYLMHCSNYVTSLIIVQKVQKAEQVLEKLQNEIPELKKHLVDTQDVYPPILHAQKVTYLHSSKYTALIGMEKKVAPFLVVGNPYFPKTAITEIHYAIAYAYFKTHQYDKSLTHLNKVIHNKDLLSNCSVFYIGCFIMVYLLCHYQLHNTHFLKYEIDRQKEMATQLNVASYELLHFFKLLNKLCNYPDNRKKSLIKYLPIFEAYETNNPKSTIFLSIVDWIKEQLNSME